MKKSIIRNNFILTIGFGILMGIVFPFYSLFFVNFKSLFHLIFFCCGCVIAGIIVGLVAFSITKKTIISFIANISEQLGQMSRGEGDLTKSLLIQSDDKIGELANNFNLFLDNLKNMISQTKNNYNESYRLSNNLNQIVVECTESFKSLSKSYTSVYNSYQNQSYEVEKIKNTLQHLQKESIIIVTEVMEFLNLMDSLSMIIVDQSRSLECVLDGINKISKKIGDKEDVVSKYTYSKPINNKPEILNDSFDDDLLEELEEEEDDGNSLILKTDIFVKEMLFAIKKLADSLHITKDKIKDIDDISTKTNLLAINASIEASHAGDKGKGFNVVATEIRKLADNSRGFTKDIHNILESIDNETNSILLGSEKQKKEFIDEILSLKTTIQSLNTHASSISDITESIKNTYRDIIELLSTIRYSLDNLKEATDKSESSLKTLEEFNIESSLQISSISNSTKMIEDMFSFLKNDILTFFTTFEKFDKNINKYNV